ncbi:MAG: hypothetical protein KDA78_06895 [Planctomycetaceae bacterium]|nr:hypothetical protein [Planctomycetaceae bacterium]
MAVYFFLVFDRPLDPELLEVSLNEVVTRHPLLCARVKKKFLVPYWEQIQNPPIRIQPISREKLLTLPPIDLTQERGLRCWILDQEQSSSMTICLEFHHSCVDALAIAELVRQWQAEYLTSRGADPDNPQCEPVQNPPCILKRGVRRLGWLSRDQLVRIGKFCLRSDLSSVYDRDQKESSPRRVCFWQFEGVVQKLQHRPAIEGTSWTINDLLLAALYAALFRMMQPKVSPKKSSIRVGVPFSVRDAAQVPEAMANCFSMVFLEREMFIPDSHTDRLRLIQNHALEIQEMRREKAEQSMLHLLRSTYPFYLMPKSATQCGVILSNLGNAHRVLGETLCWQDAKLQQMNFLPPLQDSINLAIGVLGLNGDLHLGVLSNCNRISPDFLNQFESVFREEVDHFLAAVATLSPSLDSSTKAKTFSL